MKDTISMLPEDEHNAKLLSQVHPADWVNPVPEPMYNLVVIGAGSAGLISSIITASLGGKVALIEEHLMGGDCLNTGCVPSKSLLRSARLASEMKKATHFGLSPHTITKDDFPAIMERLRSIRASISKNDSVERYSSLGVDVFLGRGSFTGKNTITVGSTTIHFKKAIIATGARAVCPDIPNIHSIDYLTNETIFTLTTLPEHLIVIGAGPIGCELAQAFSRLGAKVSIIQKSRLLPNEDAEAAEVLLKTLEKEGIEIFLNAKILSSTQNSSGKKILCIEQNGVKKEIVGSDVLIGVGRAPNVENFGLDVAGVDFDTKKGIHVDKYLRTSNKNIYAAGDCCMDWKFTHAADASAQIAVQNALFMGRKTIDSLIMPWCTYTEPEIAHVGLYPHEAEKKKIAIDTFVFKMEENDRAIIDGNTEGFVKIIVRKGTGNILGATIVSSHAGEMINEITMAMHAGVSLGKLAQIIHPYPTQAEAIKRTAGLYMKTRLTPFIKKMLSWWLAIARK